MKLLSLAVLFFALISTAKFNNIDFGTHTHAHVCENIGKQTLESPSGEYKAIIFSRNCGNDTSVNTHVSIVRVEDALPDENGNTFMAKHKAVPLNLRWTDEYQLQIAGVSVDSPDKQNTKAAGVQVTYSKS
jgi:hypothetical protein